MTDTEKIVTWGLLAFIAYELYKPAPVPALRHTAKAMPGTTPTWIKQLSETEQNEFAQEFSENAVTFEITENLLSIPQGPGGVPTGPLTLEENFFSPTRGIFANCQ